MITHDQLKAILIDRILVLRNAETTAITNKFYNEGLADAYLDILRLLSDGEENILTGKERTTILNGLYKLIHGKDKD